MTVALTIVDDEGVETEVSEEELAEAGWIRESDAADYVDPCGLEHCGGDECSCAQISPEALAVLTDWHDENHAGVFRLCYETPCKALLAEVYP